MRFNKNEKIIITLLLVLFITLCFFSVVRNQTVLIEIASLFSLVIILIFLVGNLRRLRLQLVQVDRNNQAATALYNILKPIAPLPEFGGYALPASKAIKLADLLLDKKPKLIVELGSGVSTLVFAYCFKIIGEGKIVSFDHDEKFAEITRENLKKHGLSEYAEVRHAPLGEIDSEDGAVKWYKIDISKVSNNIDLLFIDGPPRKSNRLARLPALSFFKDKLSEKSIVILDDANRHDEIAIKNSWLENNKELEKDKNYYRDDMFIGYLNKV